ncbi:unnamed protein product [Ranitomeya imitator]|uniref:Transmembrane protein 267 n=1 Tax=Ranitomeya imitator TaxID=111125 RepID=A0ABN9LWU6_9NEOB|nr:unnamed protein product [Ranitomeya imitator]
MASEMEKADALLQTFSTASVASSLGLGIFCFLADKVQQAVFIQQNDWLRALSDSTTHGVIGMWSWAIVIGLRKRSDFCEVILAGFFACIIDLDHFFLAGSFSLQVSDVVASNMEDWGQTTPVSSSSPSSDSVTSWCRGHYNTPSAEQFRESEDAEETRPAERNLDLHWLVLEIIWNLHIIRTGLGTDVTSLVSTARVTLTLPCQI